MYKYIVYMHTYVADICESIYVVVVDRQYARLPQTVRQSRQGRWVRFSIPYHRFGSRCVLTGNWKILEGCTVGSKEPSPRYTTRKKKKGGIEGGQNTPGQNTFSSFSLFRRVFEWLVWSGHLFNSMKTHRPRPVTETIGFEFCANWQIYLPTSSVGQAAS